MLLHQPNRTPLQQRFKPTLRHLGLYLYVFVPFGFSYRGQPASRVEGSEVMKQDGGDWAKGSSL
jgi:hypothetical protein